MKMYFEIEQMGGWIEALTSGWVHAQLRKGLLEIQKKVESGERAVIGANMLHYPS